MGTEGQNIEHAGWWVELALDFEAATGVRLCKVAGGQHDNTVADKAHCFAAAAKRLTRQICFSVLFVNADREKAHRFVSKRSLKVEGLSIMIFP